MFQYQETVKKTQLKDIILLDSQSLKKHEQKLKKKKSEDE